MLKFYKQNIFFHLDAILAGQDAIVGLSAAALLIDKRKAQLLRLARVVHV